MPTAPISSSVALPASPRARVQQLVARVRTVHREVGVPVGVADELGFPHPFFNDVAVAVTADGWQKTAGGLHGGPAKVEADQTGSKAQCNGAQAGEGHGNWRHFRDV